MALRIELYENGSLVDGVEEWWDDVETAIAGASREYPLLASVNPYGELTLAPGLLGDLANECHRLANQATNRRAGELLLRIASLCDRAAASDAAVLRFNGD